jgi:primase-polymerase (primpol)-like protein
VIPAELSERAQWVCWRSEVRDGKPTKVPYCPTRPRERASTTDPETWGTFEQASAVEGVDGIGYVFSEDDPYSGIDLDNCIDGSTLETLMRASSFQRAGEQRRRPQV